MSIEITHVGQTISLPVWSMKSSGCVGSSDAGESWNSGSQYLFLVGRIDRPFASYYTPRYNHILKITESLGQVKNCKTVGRIVTQTIHVISVTFGNKLEITILKMLINAISCILKFKKSQHTFTKNLFTYRSVIICDSSILTSVSQTAFH